MTLLGGRLSPLLITCLLALPAQAQQNTPLTLAEAEDIALDIVFEDDDLIVVNKPAGMVVHPSAGHASGTLVNALLHRFGERRDTDDGEGDIIEGNANEIKRQRDVWTFSREMGANDPNWVLVATGE